MKLTPWLVLALASCRSAAPDASAELLAADRAFAADTQARRVEGWLAAFDRNGSQVDGDFHPVTGHEAIRAHMEEFFADPRNSLSWRPDCVRISEGGNLGTTSGRYELRYPLPDGSGEHVESGRYFDVWRKLPDGTWKLLYDIGEPDERRAPPAS